MSLNVTGSLREPAWWPSQLKAQTESALRIRSIEGSTGLQPFRAVNWSDLFMCEDQIGNSCLDFSAMQCLMLWHDLNGILPRSIPKKYRAYWYARRRHGQERQDAGTYTGSIWWAIRKFGCVPEPADYERADALRDLQISPRAADDISAVDVKVTAKQIIDLDRERLVYRICDSLALGQPVQLSLPVERSFLDPQVPRLVDAPSGDQNLAIGHAVTAIGCRSSTRPDITTLPEILIGNSWGKSWGNMGTCWLTGRYVSRAYGVWYVEKVEGWQ